jgi:phenylalanyl-tRNA synthetase beta chain
MRAPLSWLRDFAPFEPDVDHLVETFSNLGLVVDGVERVGAGMDGVVVARVLALRPHPDADRIQLVDVDAGDGDALQICCGAFNMRVGDLVPLATLGTVLPGGAEIARRKMRGEWSNGMLCSAVELDFPDETGGQGILILPKGTAEPGTPLTEALGLTDDVVFDLDISPNRPDALSMAGVARDLAAALKVPFEIPTLSLEGAASTGLTATVEVRDPDLCPRFTATVFEGVRVGPSPEWIVRRLMLAGMRAINNVVDASNFVMLDLGQPNHPYDLDRVPGSGLIVRRAREGERLVTLDDVERILDPDDLLICDGTDAPVGIAGIMGGAASEISDSTSRVLLEAAYFNPSAIARTGKRVGLSTEARTRFERGCDPEVTDLAVARFASLLPGAAAGSTVDARSARHLPGPVEVDVRTDRVNAVLGTDLSRDDIASLLGPIGFGVTPAGDGVQRVTVPTWRPDTAREIDVVEEVARHHGYQRIARTLPPGVKTGGGLTAYQKERRRVRDVLAGTGLLEAWTTTFLAPGDLERAGLAGEAVEVENPLDQSESLLRTSLLPGLLKALKFNADRQASDVRLFEIGRIFLPPSTPAEVLPEEREDLAVAISGAGAGAETAARLWAVLAGALRLEGVGLRAGAAPGMHPTRTAHIVVEPSGAALGQVGEVDPDVVAAYGLAASGRIGFMTVSLEALLASPRRSALAQPVSRYPASDIDLAFVVPETVPAGAVEATLRQPAAGLIESVTLFDVYRGPALPEGHRSLAFHLVLRAMDRTLTDAEVADIRRRCIEAAEVAHGARLRG